MPRHQAILLLGPTGSGKTPLGEMLQARGLADGRRCAHFDFGDRLRRIAAGQLSLDELTGDDRAFIDDVLQRGALLEDDHFHIAEKILRAFIAEQNIGPGDESWRGRLAHESHPPQADPGRGQTKQGRDGPATRGQDARVTHGRDAHATIILNGLPRHVGQAGDVDRIVEVQALIELRCTPKTVLARLAADTGGDRAGRIDDDPARVRKKLELYTRRTEGLLDHYRSLGAAVISLTVGPDTAAEDAWRELEREGNREQGDA